jgi:hypothetical protein
MTYVTRDFGTWLIYSFSGIVIVSSQAERRQPDSVVAALGERIGPALRQCATGSQQNRHASQTSLFRRPDISPQSLTHCRLPTR